MNNKINGRTHDEFKHDYMMYRLSRANEWDEHCAGSLTLKGRVETAKWAYDYIQQLEAWRDQYKRERDAAVESLRGWCEVCVHWGSEDFILFCDGCTHNYPFEHETNFSDRWQWRGVQEDSHGTK